MIEYSVQNAIAAFQAVDRNARLEAMYNLPEGLLVPSLTDKAVYYLILGVLSERFVGNANKIESVTKPGRGRPPKKDFDSFDCVRAGALFCLAHGLMARINKCEINTSEPVRISTRQLIEVAQKVGDKHLFPQNQTLTASLEQSVSRGKKALGIGKHWELPEE